MSMRALNVMMGLTQNGVSSVVAKHSATPLEEEEEAMKKYVAVY